MAKRDYRKEVKATIKDLTKFLDKKGVDYRIKEADKVTSIEILGGLRYEDLSKHLSSELNMYNVNGYFNQIANYLQLKAGYGVDMWENKNGVVSANVHYYRENDKTIVTSIEVSPRDSENS